MAFQQSNHHGERNRPKPAPTEPPSDQGAGKKYQGRSLAELRSKKLLVKEARGRGVISARRDINILHYAIGDWYYKWTPTGYLVDMTHRYGDPENNNLGSDSESDSE